MKSIKLFAIAILSAGMFLASCAKPATPPADLVAGDECPGTYTGTVHVVSSSPAMDTTVSGTMVITKTTDDLVSMTMTIPLAPTQTLDSIAVAGTAYPISLSKTTGFTGPTGPLTGTVDDKTLNWLLVISPGATYTFAGTKP